MNVSPTVLVLSVAIGVPLLLLALGVLYHAYVLGRQQSNDYDDLGAHVEALATESTDALLIDLRDAVEHMQGQLARQRESLAGLLSEDARASRGPLTAAPAMAPIAPMMPSAMPRPVEPDLTSMTSADPRPAAGSFVYNTRVTPAVPTATGSLTSAVADLVAEGLSDRAIARQLHVGLEEVRMARMRVGR
jgi:hypothetical protein